MPCVSKCCCCCSLKYGYLTYGIICLIIRICVVMSLIATTDGFKMIVRDRDNDVVLAIIPVAGAYIGWFLATSFILIIALKGIVEKRSILLYPFIVVLIIEIIAGTISSVIEAAVLTPWFLLQLLFIVIIDGYALACTIGLYQHMKQKEKNPIMLDAMPFKTV